MIKFTTPVRENFDGWSRNCTVNGVEFQVSVRRGKSVRIPYKPRGKNRGWHWHGTVYSAGKCLWNGRVTKSIGVRGLLDEAGVRLEEPSVATHAFCHGDYVRWLDDNQHQRTGWYLAAKPTAEGKVTVHIEGESGYCTIIDPTRLTKI